MGFSLRKSVSDATRDHRQIRSGDIRTQRCLTLITMVMVLSPAGTFRLRYAPTTAASNFFFPRNVDFHTDRQQQFLHSSKVPSSASQPHNLSTFNLPILTFHPTITILSHSVWATSVEPHRFSLWSRSGTVVFFWDVGNLQLLRGWALILGQMLVQRVMYM